MYLSTCIICFAPLVLLLSFTGSGSLNVKREIYSYIYTYIIMFHAMCEFTHSENSQIAYAIWEFSDCVA